MSTIGLLLTIALAWLASMAMQQPPVQLPPATSPPTTSSAGFPGGAWQWQSTHHADGTIVTAADPSRYTVTFQSNGQLMIRADCNTVLGSYTVSGAELSIMLGPSTLVGCPPDSQADQFVADLASVSGFAVVDGNLQLQLGSTGGQMFLAPHQVPGLVGPTWELTGYNNGRGGVQSVLTGTHSTAVFSPEGQTNGSAGCNTFFGPYQTSGNSLTIGPLASTRMACDPPIMQQEAAYLAALQNTAQYQFESDQLVLRDATGATQATFVQATN
jgi:heat shock protein HslJ